MKRILLIMLVALVGMAVQGMARTNLTAGVPDVKKIVLVNADRVNIRKQPNTSSKRVGRVTRGSSILVTGESGDWYAVVINEDPDDSHEGVPMLICAPKIINGYIMKKYCDDAELVPLTTDMLSWKSDRYDIVASGTHEGVVVEQVNVGWGSATVWIGRMKGNIWCFDRSALADTFNDDFQQDEDSMMFNFSSLTDAQIDIIMGKTYPSFAKAVFCVKGKDSETIFYYSED